MDDILDDLLIRGRGVAARRRVLDEIGRAGLDGAVRRRELVSPFPRVYCRPWDADLLDVLHRGALVSVGQPAALSHDTALGVWALNPEPTESVDVVVPAHRRITTNCPRLRVHRTRTPTRVRRHQGLEVTTPAGAIVQVWSSRTGSAARSPAIEAVRRRICTPAELETVASASSRLARRAEFGRLVGLLTAGCESDLELYGLTCVFVGHGLDHGVPQHEVVWRGRRYRLDLAFVAERVAVELDGRTYHSGRDSRERDLTRDAALAAAGWLTIRLSSARLHSDPEGCRRDVRATLAVRGAPVRGARGAC